MSDHDLGPLCNWIVFGDVAGGIVCFLFLTAIYFSQYFIWNMEFMWNISLFHTNSICCKVVLKCHFLWVISCLSRKELVLSLPVFNACFCHLFPYMFTLLEGFSLSFFLSVLILVSHSVVSMALFMWDVLLLLLFFGVFFVVVVPFFFSFFPLMCFVTVIWYCDLIPGGTSWHLVVPQTYNAAACLFVLP